MNIFHCSSDERGGAARAALRLHQALQNIDAVSSRMLVKNKSIDDWRIEEVGVRRFNSIHKVLNSAIDNFPLKFFKSDNKVPRSTGWASILRASAIRSRSPDLIHLHWICSGFLSIEEIGKISSPLVWTLHDMWPFCGSEHLSEDGPLAPWRNGYDENERALIDLDRWVWLRKKRSWKNPMHLVAPSRWLANCIEGSKLMGSFDISVIPNVLDTEVFKPIPKIVARDILGLPQDIKIILFGAIRGTQLSYKGWDLLLPALMDLTTFIPNVQAMIIGQGEPMQPDFVNMPLNWMGHIHDDITLSLIYSAADVTVVPSRREAFGQVASEAQSCGCPVVAFNTTGLMDVVDHKVTGYLAKAYQVEDLRQGIIWVLEDDKRAHVLSISARKRALERWAPQVVVPQYMRVYKETMGKYSGLR
jgi:glycosyltransferase involved in cell wall biosynthesis